MHTLRSLFYVQNGWIFFFFLTLPPIEPTWIRMVQDDRQFHFKSVSIFIIHLKYLNTTFPCTVNFLALILQLDITNPTIWTLGYFWKISISVLLRRSYILAGREIRKQNWHVTYIYIFFKKEVPKQLRNTSNLRYWDIKCSFFARLLGSFSLT